MSANKRGAEDLQLVTRGDLPKHACYQVGTNITYGEKREGQTKLYGNGTYIAPISISDGIHCFC